MALLETCSKMQSGRFGYARMVAEALKTQPALQNRDTKFASALWRALEVQDLLKAVQVDGSGSMRTYTSYVVSDDGHKFIREAPRTIAWTLEMKELFKTTTATRTSSSFTFRVFCRQLLFRVVH